MKIIARDIPPRAAWALEQAGVHPLLARLYAARGVQAKDELDDGLGRLLPPSGDQGLKGIGAAARLLADAMAQEMTAVEEGINKLESEINQLETKLEDARARQKAMVLRSAAASSRLNVQQHGTRTSPHAMMDKFDRMERKIEEMESRADAYNPNPTLQQQFAELAADDVISRELAAMKAKLQQNSNQEE